MKFKITSRKPKQEALKNGNSKMPELSQEVSGNLNAGENGNQMPEVQTVVENRNRKKRNKN